MKTIDFLSIVVFLIGLLITAFLIQDIDLTPNATRLGVSNNQTMGYVTHEYAIMVCNDLGLTYDYEAEGYTAEEFCIDG